MKTMVQSDLEFKMSKHTPEAFDFEPRRLQEA
jgi:hypothetical protein